MSTPSSDLARLALHHEVRDKHQLELRFNYALGGGAGDQRYEVDTYLFIPRNVGLNRTNYTREDFYADVTALLRLDAVPLPLRDLADRACVTSPLRALHRALDELDTSPRPPDSRALVAHVKLYAYLFTAGVREQLGALSRRAVASARADAAVARRIDDDAATATADIRAALAAYRSIRGALWPFEKLCDESMPEAMRAADEYMSLFLDESLAIFAAKVADVSGAPEAGAAIARVRMRAAALAREEADYRHRYGYLTLAGGAAGAEYFSYRSSLIKKAVQQALYLDPREVKADKFVRNGVGAVGAALAAIWALAAQIPATLARASGGTQMLLLAIPVVAYVMKDRIKALTNEYLIAKLRRFDHTAWLTGPGLRNVGLGMLRARIREAMKFVDRSHVPADVLEMRATHRTVQVAELTQEEIINYKKVIEVSAPGDLPDDYWVRDILRLNVRHYLVRLDEPIDEVAFFDASDARFRVAEIPKVYHLNAIVRLTRRGADGRGVARLERLRIVLDKTRIVRIEHVDARGPTPLPPAKRPLRLPFRLRKAV
jgi:hypothetical protein